MRLAYEYVTFQLMLTAGTRVVFIFYVSSHDNGKKSCLILTGTVSLVRKITTVIEAVTPPGEKYALAIVTCER